jgi:glutamate 5-kinase
MFSGKPLGTFFMPAKAKLSSRKCWIGYTLKPKGKIKIDDGAAKAIVNRGKSLLPGGITEVVGDFDVGAPVDVLDGKSNSLGIGLVNYNSEDIRKIMGRPSSKISEALGQKTYDEVIHRDNLTIFNECKIEG